MHIKLPSLEIECTECEKPTAFPQVRIAPPAGNFRETGLSLPELHDRLT